MEPLSKARIKIIHSLQHKKFRLKYDKFIVEGLKINIELMRDKRQIIEEVYISNPDYLAEVEKVMSPESYLMITEAQMQQLSQMTTPPGILSICHLPQLPSLPESIDGLKIFYLDSIRDPGNLGTILRIADWFGLDFVLCSPDCVDIYNQKVIQASMGSALRVNSGSLERTELIEQYSGHLYICDSIGESIHVTVPPVNGIMVFGNESAGVSDELMDQIREKYSIPGNYSHGAESLNVASAAAIIAGWWRFGGWRDAKS